MKKRQSHVQTAHRRVSILQEIIKRERKRAEALPSDKRNIEFGFVERGATQQDARDQILECFNDLQIFLDILKIAHMAASFESEALEALNIVIDNTKRAVIDDRKGADPWPAKLTRDRKSFEGLYDIEQIIPFKEAHRKTYKKIREIRNAFAHNGRKIESPEISGDDALPVLLEGLTVLME